MKKTDIILLSGLMASILFTNFFDFGKTLYSIENEVLRMHILANSDSEEDQSLKLCVRDRLLENSDELFGECETLEQMKECAEEKKEEISAIALDVIHEKGYNYTVDTEVVNMEFDNREYGDITMPAGNYDALRVTIGEAQGKNWWCVMYPPLCLPAAENVVADDKKADEYFDEKQMDVMQNPEKYQVKFKCLEWFSTVKKEVLDWF
ncbi:MAG: stage II sporulation protein R [Ruminococcus sp.]|nr:stage II sporulation protein R [Ruminococcus sp.]